MGAVRDEFGAIKIENINMNKYNDNHYKISYNDEIYYLKKSLNIESLYNGLVAEFLAKDYGISCAYSDIYINDGFYGYMSKDINKNSKYTPISELIKMDSSNNLLDIWNILEKKYCSYDVLKIMSNIVDIFLFDILIGNSDRHNMNYFIKNSIDVLPITIIDNENMLNEYSIYDGFYSLQIDSEDYDMYVGEYNLLEKFIINSDSLYLDVLKSKLWIIEEQNLMNVFKRIEERLGVHMVEDIKKKILDKMNVNYTMISRVISKYDKGKKYEYKV